MAIVMAVLHITESVGILKSRHLTYYLQLVAFSLQIIAYTAHRPNEFDDIDSLDGPKRQSTQTMAAFKRTYQDMDAEVIPMAPYHDSSHNDTEYNPYDPYHG